MNKISKKFKPLLVALSFACSIQAQNGIEPEFEKYDVGTNSIEIDGDISDWASVPFIKPKFEARDGRETAKGNTTIGDTTYSTFAEFGGGTWNGPDDHTSAFAVAWDEKGLYLGIVVTDDEHEHAAGNAWNGDGVQMGFSDTERTTVTHLYNFCLLDGYESEKVYKSGDAGIIADKERGAGDFSVAMVRDDAAKTTTYEALFTSDSFEGLGQFQAGLQIGIGICVNDGDKDTPGQKGWSGWGPHMIVFGKTAPDAALLKLTDATYTKVITSVHKISDAKSEIGIVSNITQISSDQGVSELLGNTLINAEKQINGWGADPNTDEPYLNEADPDAFEGWSYYPTISETVNQNKDAPGPKGNFTSSNGYEDIEIPNIPGWGGSTANVVGEYFTLLELDKGNYTFGIFSDGSANASIGYKSPIIVGAKTTSNEEYLFSIQVEESGLYPYRVLWYNGGGHIELFSVRDGEKILINDPENINSIKGYLPDGIKTDESLSNTDATEGRSFFSGTRLEGYTFATDNAGETLPEGTYVRNILASQRDGTKLVDISFEIIQSEGNSVNVKVDVSDDGGVSYDVPAESFTGDVGGGVLPGSAKKIVWDAGTDWNGKFSNNIRFRITVTVE